MISLLSFFLTLFVSPFKSKSKSRAMRTTVPQSYVDERGKSAVGHAPHPWRTAQRDLRCRHVPEYFRRQTDQRELLRLEDLGFKEAMRTPRSRRRRYEPRVARKLVEAPAGLRSS